MFSYLNEWNGIGECRGGEGDGNDEAQVLAYKIHYSDAIGGGVAAFEKGERN